MPNLVDHQAYIVDLLFFFFTLLYFYKQLTLSSNFIFIYRHWRDTSVTGTFLTFSFCS
jgi:hypothetical protein